MDLPLIDDDAPPAAAPAPRPPMPWHWRLREALSTYLPLLLMAVLALATWWLVKNTPRVPGSSAPVAARHEPDYTMQGFTMQRFGDDGRLVVQVEGEQLRHYPDTDTVEVDSVRIRAYSPDGSVTNASARRALTNGDASEVQLLGGAQVERSGGPRNAVPVRFEGEFLHAFLRTERLRSHLPVVLRQGSSEVHAAGLEYDHLSGQASFKGPVRARFVAPGRGSR